MNNPTTTGTSQPAPNQPPEPAPGNNALPSANRRQKSLWERRIKTIEKLLSLPFMWLKPYLPEGLFGRSLLIIVTPMVLLQLVITYVFLERHWELVTNKLSTEIGREIAFIIDIYETYPGPPDAPILTESVKSALQMPIRFAPGDTLPTEQAPTSYILLAGTLEHELGTRLNKPFWIDATTQEYVDIRVGIEGGVLHLRPNRGRVYASNWHIFLVWMMAASLILVTVAVLFLRNQIRPIQRLATAAEQFGLGRNVETFKPAGASEVRRASLAFLQMRDRLTLQIEQRTTMLAGVSHDLRTPLTRFKLQLAMLEESPEIEELRNDVSEMEHMLEDYLAFAKGDQGEPPLPTDLKFVLQEICAAADRNNTSSGEQSQIKLNLMGDLIIPLRRNAMKRCLTNLIGNGCKYADTVTVSTQRDEHLIMIHIDDDGNGIPADKLEDVFRPFLRLDEARNLDKGGSGLGLAIARDIARSHGGEIHLSQSPSGGLRATLTLPV